MSADWRSDVLKFWFGLDQEQWWTVDADLDARIAERFGELWSEQRQFPANCFLDDPLSALAAVILFDQFPRNMFRRHADQFSTDHLALQVARAAVADGFDNQLPTYERAFLYMPFEHSERLADQQRSVQLFTVIGDDFLLGFAQKHHEVIARFGRFPHRNAMLGRTPWPEEIAAGEVVPW